MRKKRQVTAPPEPPTTPLPTLGATQPAPGRVPEQRAGPGPTAVETPADLRTAVAGAVALLCLAAVLFEATVDVLADESLFWALTPVRLVLGAGLVAVVVARVPPWRLRTPLDLPVAVLLVAAAAATVLARQDFAAWRGLLTSAATFYLVVGVRRALPGSWTSLGLLAMTAVTVAATTALRQSADGTATGFCRGTLDGSADVCGPDVFVRVIGTFSNPNLLAAFLLLMVPVAAGGALMLADRSSRLLGAALVVVGFGALLLTGSRGGYVAAAAGTVAFVVLSNPTRRRLLISAGATGVAAVLFLLAVTLGGSSVGVRADVWSAAVRLLVANPLGVGPGRAGALLGSGIAGEEAFQHAHNLWLNLALDTGMLGLVAVLAITALVTVAVIRGARAGSPVAIAAGAGLAGYAVMSLADHPANALRISLVLWTVLALAVADAPSRLLRQGAIRRRGKADPPEPADPSDLPTAVHPAVRPRAQRRTDARSRSGSR